LKRIVNADDTWIVPMECPSWESKCWCGWSTTYNSKSWDCNHTERSEKIWNLPVIFSGTRREPHVQLSQLILLWNLCTESTRNGKKNTRMWIHRKLMQRNGPVPWMQSMSGSVDVWMSPRFNWLMLCHQQMQFRQMTQYADMWGCHAPSECQKGSGRYFERQR
jgi:hypothetical protein